VETSRHNSSQQHRKLAHDGPQQHHQDGSKRRRVVDSVTSSNGGLRLEWSDFFLLKEASMYLNLTEVGNAMRTCRAWRHCLISSEKLWTGMLENRYPNLRTLRPDSKPKSRTHSLDRLQLERDPTLPFGAKPVPTRFVHPRVY
jgi:hypothetical protein